MKVKEVYDVINEYAPFKKSGDFDNCGLNVGDMEARVKKICLCLDITNDVIEEAAKKKANLIISHHPVIFDSLKEVHPGDPVYRLIKYKINAICAHTNTDITENGVTDLMIELLGFEKSNVVLEPVFSDGSGYGKVCDLPIPTTARALAESCKEAFGCTVVRFNDTDKPIQRVGLCSGGGASNFRNAVALGCDALITGDVKHDIWVDAQNIGFCMIDAGHFHTENILCNHLLGMLCHKFTMADIFVADNSKDPCSYVL
ncbi:MAG: Nif3-like dinuclear metal center hexameric protein [Eubacterium sp.]|nr:Nif3-like dinuclear metal center hexameric protein [Eubacterium sp.]